MVIHLPCYIISHPGEPEKKKILHEITGNDGSESSRGGCLAFFYYLVTWGGYLHLVFFYYAFRITTIRVSYLFFLFFSIFSGPGVVLHS